MQDTVTIPQESSKAENSITGKILLVINADTSKQPNVPPDRSKERLADYTILKTMLQGEIVDWNDINKTTWARWLSKVGGKAVALAALAFARRKHYQMFYCDAENNGLVLAALLKLSRTKKPLFMIGHWVTPRKKALLIKRFRLQTHITTLFLHSTIQYKKALEELAIPGDKLRILPYQVDTEFWNIENASPEARAIPFDQSLKPYICTAGLEFRDYPTLIEAMRELDIDLKIGAASHWSKRKNSSAEMELPPNVNISKYNYVQLRDLYAGCRFVVVPLYDVDFQAGITLILEAMSMGKAVIVTRSEGQGDTIVDQRKTTRHGPLRPTSGAFTELFGNNGNTRIEGRTGFYVSAGNAAELRGAINYLLEHPDVAEDMGRRARITVESMMKVEHFGERISRAIAEVLEQSN